ncbi:unnamed protein product [Staurois parvus]|uniref:Uncharacterized protein n=1 Tax=Staurois parvus TaxID=386267 RepID=A0ABN9BU13_9NEOB|nr:unnamed protein product [Staurois parvus]
MIPYCPGPHELSVRPYPPPLILTFIHDFIVVSIPSTSV